MRKAVVAGAAVVALAIVAIAALPIAEKVFADNIKSQLDRDGLISAGSVEVGLLARRITLREVRSQRTNGITVARWEVAGLSWPLAELLRGRTPLSGLRLGDPFSAGKIEVDGLRVTGVDGQGWSVGSAIFEGVDIERFDADVARGEFQGFTIGARLIRAVSMRRFEERDVLYTMPFTGNTLGFVSFSGADLDRGRFGSFALSAFEAAGQSSADPSFRLASLQGEGLDARRALTVMSEPSWRPGMPVGRLGLDALKASGFGGELLSRYGISLGSITVDTSHESDAVTRSTTRVDGFVLAPPTGTLEGLQMRVAMQAMDLKELKLGLACTGWADRAKGEAGVERCVLSGPDLGDLDFSSKLVGADAPFWRALESGNLLELYGTKAAFAEAKFSLADKGLLDHGLRGLAMASGQAPVTARANLANEIRRYQPPNVLITEELTKLLDTTARFIEKGGTLTIQARPDPPLPLERLNTLMRPGPDLVDLLGLTATLSK
jgi:hypothetical protein